MKPDCTKCRHFKFSVTLSSLNVPIWHCRCGFTPFIGLLYSFIPPMPYSCIEEANKLYPVSYVQLELDFK